MSKFRGSLYIEDGIDIILEEDEFSFYTAIKGLPDFAEIQKDKLYLKSEFKKRTHPIKILIDNGNNIKFEILTNLHILNVGTKRYNVLISGIEFIGKIKFYINHSTKDIEDIKLSYNYNTINIEYLIKTIDFFIKLSFDPLLEIILLEANKSLLKIKTANFSIGNDLQNEKEFLIKYYNVIKKYEIKPLEVYKLSDSDVFFIELIDTYYNKSSLAINKEQALFSIKVDDSFYKSFKENYQSSNNLSFYLYIIFNLLEKKIDLGSCRIILIRPEIIKSTENITYEIKYEKMIYDFTSEE